MLVHHPYIHVKSILNAINHTSVLSPDIYIPHALSNLLIKCKSYLFENKLIYVCK